MSDLTTSQLTKALLLRLPREFPCRIWRRNTGAGYGVDSIRRVMRMLLKGDVKGALSALHTTRPITFGTKGEADLTGIILIRGLGVRLEVEVKAGKDKMRPAQQNFAKMIRDHGGIYIEARNVDDAVLKIKGYAQLHSGLSLIAESL